MDASFNHSMKTEIQLGIVFGRIQKSLKDLVSAGQGLNFGLHRKHIIRKDKNLTERLPAFIMMNRLHEFSKLSTEFPAKPINGARVSIVLTHEYFHGTGPVRFQKSQVGRHGKLKSVLEGIVKGFALIVHFVASPEQKLC